MSILKLEINNIKNIKHGVFEIPMEKGVYAITGNNGSGKTTIINCLGKLVVDYSLYNLEHINNEENPQFSFSYEGKQDVYTLNEIEVERKNKKGFQIKPKKKNRWQINKEEQEIKFEGLYEGSFFFGKRFTDSVKIDNYLDLNKKSLPRMYPVNSFIEEQVSLILHNDTNHYKNLMHLGITKAKSLGFRNDPCFVSFNGNVVSQYSMSSGECLLISLFAFINNVIGDEMEEKRSEDTPILLLIDEIEAALHPSAIKRLLEYLTKLAAEYNFIVIISSHSAEVIRQISPRNLFNIEQLEDGSISVSNPCFPSYAIRDVYTHVGYDVVILVEDILAKRFVDQTINELRLKDNKLINILPVGGWENVIKLHKDLVNNNYFGPSTLLFCVLDGDVLSIDEYKKYRKDTTPKFFLPIPSVEKILLQIPVNPKYIKLRGKLNSYIFTTSTIESLYKEFYREDEGYGVSTDPDGKNFYGHIIKHLGRKGINEDVFIQNLCSFINETTDSTQFKENIKKYFETALG